MKGMPLLLLALIACWLAGWMISAARADVCVPAMRRSDILWSFVNEQGDDHLRERSRHPGRDPRGGPGRRDLHRARTSARGGWQHLQGPGIQGAARYAILVR